MTDDEHAIPTRESVGFRDSGGTVFTKPIATAAMCALAVLGVGQATAAADTVALTLSATIGADGTTIIVVAPGCEPTAPGSFDIVLQGRSATGEIGEGAVALGSFDAPGRGSVVVPPGTPINSFLLSVSCNGGALKGSQALVLAAPASAVPAAVNFTG